MNFLPSRQEVHTQLTEYAEGALPFSREFDIWLHLRCAMCAQAFCGA
ncbi:MAG TPA: hypothetical protein VF378_03745 [Geothrix sp.]